MATKITQDQLAQLQDLLIRDGNGNHQLLAYYLKLILGNRSIELKLLDGTLCKISPQLAWDEIIKWNEKAGLPMGDKGSRQIRASRLLNYLDLVQGNTREAATNFQAIKDSAETLSKTTPITSRGQNIKKMVDIRKLQLDIHNRQAMGQLSTLLEQASFIKRFAGDRPTQVVLTGLFAANSANFMNSDVPKHILADEITKLIQLNAGRTNNINNAAHLSYSKAAQETELDEISSIINNFATSKYKNTNEFIKETGRIAHYSHILTVGDIPELVDMLAPTATPNVRQNLARALQTTIVRSTGNYYTSGETILSHAFNLAGLPAIEAKNLSSLAPFLEEIRVTELHNTIGGNIVENDPRILNTLNVTAEIGVSAHIPWLSREDLDAHAVTLQKKYGSENLAKTLQQEIDRGDDADFEKISGIKKLFSNIEQHNYYNRTIADNPMYRLRETIGKTKGRFASFRAPIDRFSQKIGKKVWAVDDFVHSPFKYVSDKIIELQELVPVLNPGKFIYDKALGAQLWIAQHVLEWSDNLIGRGHWASSILTHISDFSHSFITENGSWHAANYSFVQKKWGNLLDWGAKKAGKGSWRAFKSEIGTTLWNGFSKMAPEMAAKLSAGEFSKIIASIVAGELSAGTTVLIQVGFMLIGEALKKIKQFFTDRHFQDQIVRRIPALIAAASVGLAAVPGALVAGIIAGGSALIAGIGVIISSLFTTIFVPALITVGALITAFFIFFQVFNITKNIDSGTSELIANIICDDSGNTTIPGTTDQNSSTAEISSSNSVAARASCLAKYLNGCYGPSVNAINIKKGLSCLATYAVAPSAIAEIEKSASGFVNLQCVGFVKAAVAWGGKSIGSANACGYVSDPKFVSGLRGIKQGDPVIFRSSGTCSDVAPGHIGIFKEDAGANICLIDANQKCAGCVVDGNCLPKTNVAGYLRL